LISMKIPVHLHAQAVLQVPVRPAIIRIMKSSGVQAGKIFLERMLYGNKNHHHGRCRARFSQF
jgi:hypothetical protein